MKAKLNIQLFAEGTTKLENMVDPEVMAPMISAKLVNAIVATPFAKVDTTLEGQAGSTITIPRYKYIGDAEDVAEGVEAGVTKLETDTDEYSIKKAMKAVTITDEAILSGYGNPIGEANSQLGKAIASKIDNDVMDELQGASQLVYNATGDISYDEVVNAIDLFKEEENVPKVMFIHPNQVTTLRKDTNFISNDKYPNNVIMRGEIGMIANTRIVASKKCEVADGIYYCPIVELRGETQTGDESSAVTIFLKRNANVETERHTLSRTTDISVDEHYIVALTDASKVVLAKFGGSVSL